MKTAETLFFERPFPSANSIVIQDEQTLLVDTGFGSDITRTEKLLSDAGIVPMQLNGIINTHYHSDHVGGNHYFQQQYDLPIAAHLWEGEMVNQCDVESCGAHYLDQPVEQYVVQQLLVDEQEIVTGNSALQVLHTPGHTLGHIALYEPKQQMLICGDLFHHNDVGWLNIFREGTNSIRRSYESLERLAKLSIKIAYPGHGRAIEDPKMMMDKARERLEKWMESPEKMAWHACKRIFSFTLMMKNGLTSKEITPYLLSCGWFHDFAVHSFRIEPKEFVKPLLDEMIRSKAAIWQQDKLMATAPYEAPNPTWIEEDWKPGNWTK
ncbi:MBL fold metallo-hydrolase [Lysinibacillus cavernae]|uniref:MBL fold metallo-hydrolase n=1 Tax=Lysinibacillus cavernae TaxID=2666135 RepID=UPI0012D9E8B1|nr:MBL fold metallo-hydrolase [Lysinibacillus cavernae]